MGSASSIANKKYSPVLVQFRSAGKLICSSTSANTKTPADVPECVYNKLIEEQELRCCRDNNVTELCALMAVNRNGNAGKLNDLTQCLVVAGYHGSLDVLRKLLKVDGVAEVLDDNDTAISLFQRIIESSQNIKTKASVVQLLLNANANVNATDTHGIFGNTGVTGIWMASQAGHVDVVREFIKAKADVNVTDTENGMTSLRAAFFEGHLDVVRELVRGKADVDAVDTKSTKTCLHLASQKGDLDTMRELVRLGADVNSKTSREGRTSLMAATMCGNLDVVRTLVELKADANVQSHNGSTVFDIPRKQGCVCRNEIMNFLGACSIQNIITNILGSQ